MNYIGTLIFDGQVLTPYFRKLVLLRGRTLTIAQHTRYEYYLILYKKMIIITWVIQYYNMVGTYYKDRF